MEKRNENLRFENTTLEMREASVDEIEYYQAFEEYEDLPHFMDANPYEDEICPYKQMKMFIKKYSLNSCYKVVHFSTALWYIFGLHLTYIELMVKNIHTHVKFTIKKQTEQGGL